MSTDDGSDQSAVPQADVTDLLNMTNNAVHQVMFGQLSSQSMDQSMNQSMNQSDIDARPFLAGVSAPTEEEWEMLFEDAKRSNAKYVIMNNPGISYSTFCARLARWDKGERESATKAITSRGRRGRPRGLRTPTLPQLPNGHSSSDDTDASDGDNPSKKRRYSLGQGNILTGSLSRSSAFHPFSPFVMPPILNPPINHIPADKPDILACLGEVELQMTEDIKNAAKSMRQSGGWIAKSNALIDQMEAKEIQNLKDELEVARLAIESVRKLRGDTDS